MGQSIKQFLKPERRRVILFLILFLIMFVRLPFVKLVSTGETESILWFIQNHSGSQEDFLTILFGLIIYLLAAYFVSCAITSLWDEFRKKKPLVK